MRNERGEPLCNWDKDNGGKDTNALANHKKLQLNGDYNNPEI